MSSSALRTISAQVLPDDRVIGRVTAGGADSGDGGDEVNGPDEMTAEG